MKGFSGSGGLLVVAAVLLIVVFLIVTLIPDPPTVDQENAAAMLTLISAGAVAIERVIETLWIMVGTSGRPWWPFTKVGNRVEAMIKTLDENLIPIRDKAKAIVEDVGAGAETSTKLANQFPNLNQARWLIDDLDQLGPNNRRARDIAKAASISADWFEKNHPEDKIKHAAARVQYTADALTNFLDTFKDNPGRRLISLGLGCIIGVGVAGVLGLDALQATLGTTPFQNIGTAVTGIVIGLGANPTHELIKTLQESKQRNRSV